MSAAVIKPRRRWTLVVRLEHRYVGVRGWRAREVLEDAGLNPRWDDNRREWYVYGKRHTDALAAVESCRAALRIEGSTARPEDQLENWLAKVKAEHNTPEDTQLELFGGDVA